MRDVAAEGQKEDGGVVGEEGVALGEGCGEAVGTCDARSGSDELWLHPRQDTDPSIDVYVGDPNVLYELDEAGLCRDISSLLPVKHFRLCISQCP